MLRRSFLSWKTYTDVLLSTHFAVSLIAYIGDEYATIPPGTDSNGCCWNITNNEWMAGGLGIDIHMTTPLLNVTFWHDLAGGNSHQPSYTKVCQTNSQKRIIWSSQYAKGWSRADLWGRRHSLMWWHGHGSGAGKKNGNVTTWSPKSWATSTHHPLPPSSPPPLFLHHDMTCPLWPTWQ